MSIYVKHASMRPGNALRKVDVEEVEVQRRLDEARGDRNKIDPVLGLRKVSRRRAISTVNVGRGRSN